MALLPSSQAKHCLTTARLLSANSRFLFSHYSLFTPVSLYWFLLPLGVALLWWAAPHPYELQACVPPLRPLLRLAITLAITLAIAAGVILHVLRGA